MQRSTCQVVSPCDRFDQSSFYCDRFPLHSDVVSVEPCVFVKQAFVHLGCVAVRLSPEVSGEIGFAELAGVKVHDFGQFQHPALQVEMDFAPFVDAVRSGVVLKAGLGVPAWLSSFVRKCAH